MVLFVGGLGLFCGGTIIANAIVEYVTYLAIRIARFLALAFDMMSHDTLFGMQDLSLTKSPRGEDMDQLLSQVDLNNGGDER